MVSDNTSVNCRLKAIIAIESYNICSSRENEVLLSTLVYGEYMQSITNSLITIID